MESRQFLAAHCGRVVHRSLGHLARVVPAASVDGSRLQERQGPRRLQLAAPPGKNAALAWGFQRRGEEGAGGGGGCTWFVHGRSRITTDFRVPTMPGRSTSGCHQPGRDCLHQARSAVRCSASRIKGEPRPSKNRSYGGLRHLVPAFFLTDDSANELLCWKRERIQGLYFSDFWPHAWVLPNAIPTCAHIYFFFRHRHRHGLICLACVFECSVGGFAPIIALGLSVAPNKRKKTISRFLAQKQSRFFRPTLNLWHVERLQKDKSRVLFSQEHPPGTSFWGKKTCKKNPYKKPDGVPAEVCHDSRNVTWFVFVAIVDPFSKCGYRSCGAISSCRNMAAKTGRTPPPTRAALRRGGITFRLERFTNDRRLSPPESSETTGNFVLHDSHRVPEAIYF